MRWWISCGSGTARSGTVSPSLKPPPATLGTALDAAADLLRRAGLDQPDRLALQTWAALARISPARAQLGRAAPVPGGDAVRDFRAAVERQAAGEPLKYAVSLAGFRQLDLFVDRRVLIPRSETESLVDHVLGHAGRSGWGVVADIGTGSGAIALALATEGRFERVIATDVSRDALDVARQNRETVGPGTPVEFRNGSNLAALAGQAGGV